MSNFNSLAVVLVVFTTAYCIQPLLVDGLKYQGAASPSTFIYLVPHYLAMVVAGFFLCDPTAKHQKLTVDNWIKAAYISFVDIAHQITEKAGLVFAGSGVYIVIGSSSIVWTAIFAVLMLNKKYTGFQWLGLSLIFLGLVVKATSIEFRFENDEFLGITLTLTSSILHGLTFVTNEKYLTGVDSLSGPLLVFMMGAINLVVLLLWTLVWTLPQWDTLIYSSIASRNGRLSKIILLFLGMFVCGLIQSSTLWFIIKMIGAVSTGVIKGLKTATVFILSHFLFCKLQASQCLTPNKALSAFVCMIGVFLYSAVTVKKKTENKMKGQMYKDGFIAHEKKINNEINVFGDNTNALEDKPLKNCEYNQICFTKNVEKKHIIKNASDIFYCTNTINDQSQN